MSDDHVEQLRRNLSRIDERTAAEIRPSADGGAVITAIAHADDPLDALISAYRSVATTGARPMKALLGHAILPELIALLRLDSVVDAVADAVTVIGEVEDAERCTPMSLECDGDLIYWLGAREAEGSIEDQLTHERKVGEVLVSASRDGLLNAALDVATGGVATTIAAMALLGGRGCRFWLPDRVDTDRALFDSELGGVICIVPRTEELRFSDMSIARHLTSERIGVVDGTDLEFQGHFTIPVSSLVS